MLLVLSLEKHFVIGKYYINGGGGSNKTSISFVFNSYAFYLSALFFCLNSVGKIIFIQNE